MKTRGTGHRLQMSLRPDDTPNRKWLNRGSLDAKRNPGLARGGTNSALRSSRGSGVLKVLDIRGGVRNIVLHWCCRDGFCMSKLCSSQWTLPNPQTQSSLRPDAGLRHHSCSGSAGDKVSRKHFRGEPGKHKFRVPSRSL